MPSFRRALGSLPPRPALYISVVIVAAVLIYDFGSEYLACRGHAADSAALQSAIDAAAAPGGSRQLALADLTDFDWDRVDIQLNFVPDVEIPGCPLGSGWSTEEREAIADEGNLTVLVFSRDGAPVDYIEHHADVGAFRDIDNPYAPADAVFTVDREGGNIVLRPAPR